MTLKCLKDSRHGIKCHYHKSNNIYDTYTDRKFSNVTLTIYECHKILGNIWGLRIQWEHLTCVFINEFSRYHVVEIVRSTPLNKVLTVIEKNTSQFGITKVIKTGNESP